MVQAMVEIPKDANQILNIVKAKHNLRTKSEAITLVIKEYGTNLLEPELRPEYVSRVSKIKNEKGIPFESIGALRKMIEE